MQGGKTIGVHFMPWAVVCLALVLPLAVAWQGIPPRVAVAQAGPQAVCQPDPQIRPGTDPVQPTPTPDYALGGRVLTTIMTGHHLRDADISTDSQGKTIIRFEFTDEGAHIFRDFTTTHVGETVAIVLDKRVVFAPVIQRPITDGKGIISGDFSMEAARDTLAKMKYGALPIPLKVIETRQVGTTLLYQLFEALLRPLRVREAGLPYTALEVLLEADLPPGTGYDPPAIEDAGHILEKRANSLGVAEVTVRPLDNNRLAMELTGVGLQSKPMVESLCAPGVLEFVAAGRNRLREGQLVHTSLEMPDGATPPPAASPTRNIPAPGCG